MAKKLPLPIPYQGSKRMLAPMIYPLLPSDVVSFYEPFAGSAAMTLFVAHHGVTKRYVLGDTLGFIVDLWASIIEQTSKTAKGIRRFGMGKRPLQRTISTVFVNAITMRRIPLICCIWFVAASRAQCVSMEEGGLPNRTTSVVWEWRQIKCL